MAFQLGQLLLEQKLVTQHQLQEALKSQAIFGGRLGSQLVDSGALDERTLAKILGQLHRVPFAHAGHFASLPQELLDCLPKQLVEKYSVIPLKKENKRLYLAVADPADQPAIEEIAFRTGFVVRPVITPETLLFGNLKRYYGIERPGSYIVVEQPEETAHSPATETTTESGPDTWLGGPEQDAIMAEWERKNLEMRQAAEQGESRPQPPPPERLGARLAEHLDRETMADLLADHLAREYGCGALLLVRGETLLGWRGIGNGSVVKGFENFQLDLRQPSALQTVALGKKTYLGPLAPLPANQLIATALGRAMPEMVLIVPVVLLDRLVGMIYVDNPELNLPQLRDEVQKLATMLTLGLEMLILKNKLAVM